MTKRLAAAASLLALVSACSQDVGPSARSATEQGYDAYRAGNFAAAEQAYGGALAANPGNATAMLGLAEVYEQTGRMAEAAELYAQVHAARSGSIRVWRDVVVRQDGVTEVAARRLGALGHGGDMAMRGAILPYPETLTTGTLPGEPTYALDDEGMVFYADPEATRPIAETVYATPEAAMGGMVPASLKPMAAPVYAAPAYVAPVAPAPVMPLPLDTMPLPPAAPVSYAPDTMRFEPAPATYAPTPVSYAPAPAPVPTAMPAVEYMPMPRAAAYSAAPAPVATTRQQPGYAVVNGDYVYISAEDIAAGMTADPAPDGATDTTNGIRIPNLR